MIELMPANGITCCVYRVLILQVLVTTGVGDLSKVRFLRLNFIRFTRVVKVTYLTSWGKGIMLLNMFQNMVD